MSDKYSIVIDTNFVIENMQGLRELHEKLSENYDVYISEVSINERISQKYIDLKSKYLEIEKYGEKYSVYATIKIKRNFHERFELEKKYTEDAKTYVCKSNKRVNDFLIR